MCDFQQCGIFTSVDSDETVQPLFKLRKPQIMFSPRIFKRQTKALIRLRVCPGGSEILLIERTTLVEISCTLLLLQTMTMFPTVASLNVML